MALNIRYPKALDSITLPVGADVRSGDPVVVGNVRGVAITDPHGVEYNRDGSVDESTIPDAPTATVKLIGSYTLEVAGAASPGDLVYFDDGTLNVAGDGAPYGVALGEKGSGEGSLEVAPLGYIGGAGEGTPGPQGPAGPEGPQGPAGEDGAPSQSEWDDLVSRVEALEA